MRSFDYLHVKCHEFLYARVHTRMGLARALCDALHVQCSEILVCFFGCLYAGCHGGLVELLVECVLPREKTYDRLQCIHIYIYIYIHICVYMYMYIYIYICI